ncbi:MAG: ribonuclease J, partial [Alphaproteobacteria bacterium]|nr:ribonuclease J [Alphaproteobacteria bacterium]
MSAAKANDRLIYMALGGAGEIGMNCYVYGYGPKGKERLIVIDLGVTFPDMDGTPGVDLIFPDITWLKERRAQIEGIFITHAHEDHVGAVGLLWEQLGAPIYARKFTANIARRKLQEKGHPDNVVTVVEPYPAVIDCGPFKVSYVPISHSIPESAGLVIDSAAGRIVHTGDFKVDMTPVVGDPFNTALWEEIAKDGVKALVCDSTNIFSPHAGRSEMSIGPAITELMRNATGMVAATTFASNIARLKTLADAAVAAGRTVCLLGRSMNRMVEAAKETGLLTNFPATIGPEDAVNVPRNQLMLLVTGSQGERRAASAQLSQGSYLGLKLKEGDTFLFSSKTIPGNEKGVIRIMNQLSELGVDIVDDDGGKYHVSGHANRPDLETMHQIIKPQFLIPMHGEHRH